MNERLLKLLRLTTSSNDHEALSALRKAQAIMNVENITWEDTFAADRDMYSVLAQQIRTKSAELDILNSKIREAQGKLERISEQIDETPRVRAAWERPTLAQMAGLFQVLDSLISEHTRSSSRGFFESLRSQWNARRSLSDKQFACLLRMYQQFSGLEFKF